MQESRLNVGGCVTLWRVANATNYEKVRAGLTDCGLADFIPEPRSPQSCLRAVIDEVYTPPDKEEKYSFETYKNGVTGYTVESRNRSEQLRPGDSPTTVVAVVGLKEDGTLALNPYDYGKEQAILAGMARAKEWLPSASISKSLTEIVDYLKGVCLRENGGVYWLNDWALHAWAQAADVFESASAEKDDQGKPAKANRVYVLKVVADENMIRCVGEYLADEVEREVASIEAELNTPDIKPYVAIRRMDKANRILEKVERYGEAFGNPLKRLEKLCEKASTDAALASLGASAAQMSH